MGSVLGAVLGKDVVVDGQLLATNLNVSKPASSSVEVRLADKRSASVDAPLRGWLTAE